MLSNDWDQDIEEGTLVVGGDRSSDARLHYSVWGTPAVSPQDGSPGYALYVYDNWAPMEFAEGDEEDDPQLSSPPVDQALFVPGTKDDAQAAADYLYTRLNGGISGVPGTSFGGMPMVLLEAYCREVEASPQT